MIKHIPPDDYIELHDDPLAKYYRMPGLHVKLPSNGAFMPPGSVEFTMNNDVPVYPMRAADELLLKSPDALMSGHAIEELIRSCVPAIRMPRMISSADLDVLLLAIRAATYGATMTVQPICPKCEAENEVEISLAAMMATATSIDPENAVRLSDDVVVFLRPYTMENATKIGIASFEETRKVQGVEDAQEAARSAQINQSMNRIVTLTMDILASAILKVSVREGEVGDPMSIRRFIDNVSKAWIDKLHAKMDEMGNKGMDKHYDVTCAKCGHEWKPEVEFNPSSFFASVS